jgi:hypothetical protein
MKAKAKKLDMKTEMFEVTTRTVSDEGMDRVKIKQGIPYNIFYTKDQVPTRHAYRPLDVSIIY